jgi:hypothetical protein
MRKRQWKVLLSLTLLAAVGFLVFCGPFQKHRINRQGYAGIAAGMTEKQVSDIMCSPPGEFSNIHEDKPENRILHDNKSCVTIFGNASAYFPSLTSVADLNFPSGSTSTSHFFRSAATKVVS